ALADELAEGTTEMQGALLRDVASAWAERAPSEVLDWISARAGSATERSVAAIAVAVARNDVAAAARYADRLPAGARDAWLAEVASIHAGNDMDGALRWIEQYRGQRFYDLGVARIAGMLAASDARRAAGMLTSLRPDAQAAIAATVGDRFAGQDASAAADWAASFTDPDVRSTAVRVVAQRWVRGDADAARSWILSLP